jgi:hypothetical protein
MFRRNLLRPFTVKTEAAHSLCTRIHGVPTALSSNQLKKYTASHGAGWCGDNTIFVFRDVRLHLGQDTALPDWEFSWLSAGNPGEFWDSTQITSRQRSYEPFPIYIVTISGWLQTGYGFVNGFTDHLYSELQVNYSAIINLHTLQITTAPAKHFSSLLSSSAVRWQRLLTVESLQFPARRSYLHSLPFRTQLSAHNSQAGGHFTPTS